MTTLTYTSLIETLVGDNVISTLDSMRADLFELIPELEPLVGCTQNRHHRFDAWHHTLAVVSCTDKSNLILRLAALFHDVGKPSTKGIHPKTGDVTFYQHDKVGALITEEVLLRLGAPTEVVYQVYHLVFNHFVKYTPEWTDSALRRWVLEVGSDSVPDLIALGRADLKGKGLNSTVPTFMSYLDHLEERLKTFEVNPTLNTTEVKLAASGQDVMAWLGIQPGPKVGLVLESLQAHIEKHPDHNDKASLFNWLTQSNHFNSLD